VHFYLEHHLEMGESRLEHRRRKGFDREAFKEESLMRTRSIFLGALLVGQLATPASAAQALDPKDSASRLDVRVVKVTGEHGEVGTVTVETFGEWRARYLRFGNNAALAVRFDDGDDEDKIGCRDLPGGGQSCSAKRFEVLGNFLFRKGTLIFRLNWAGARTSKDHREEYPALHPDRHTATVEIPFDAPFFKEEHLGAAARSDDSHDCGAPKCGDDAPDGRPWVRVY
jgi:hypothetical protein